MNKNLKMLSTAAALVVLLGACATTESGNNENSAATSSSTKYCHKDRFYVANGEMICNWTNSAGSACRDNVPSSRIAQTAVTAEPSNARRCESGQWLVQVTMK